MFVRVCIILHNFLRFAVHFYAALNYFDFDTLVFRVKKSRSRYTPLCFDDLIAI